MTLLCTASQISLGHKPSGQSQGWRAKRMPSGQVAQPDKKLRGLPVAQQTSHNTTASSLLTNKASYHGAVHSDTCAAITQMEHSGDNDVPLFRCESSLSSSKGWAKSCLDTEPGAGALTCLMLGSAQKKKKKKTSSLGCSVATYMISRYKRRETDEILWENLQRCSRFPTLQAGDCRQQ